MSDGYPGTAGVERAAARSTRRDMLLSVDLLILDDFGLDAMDATESRDI